MRRTFVVRGRRSRTRLAALCVVLPARLRRLVMTRLLGHDIAPDARVGRAFVDVGHLRMASGSWIAGPTVIRGCDDVDLGVNAKIGHLVLVNGIRRDRPDYQAGDRNPALVLERGASISTLHFVDTTDTVRIGEYSQIAGLGTQVLTHSMDFVRMRDATAPVTIGHHCLIGTGVILLPGTDVPECSIVSAGSAVGPASIQDSHRFYAGVPAEAGRTLSPRIPWFRYRDADADAGPTDG